ncbi:MAG: hypothetical protein PHZ02_01625 [Desulfocapsaceae bacterium]|nr:hypothetical protein [Desulfocapsaceae bacterium]
MVSEELALIERLGIGGSAFFLVYLLLKRMQEKMFEISDKMINLTENVIKENTKTLQQMRDAMETHVKQKDPLIQEFKECKRERDEFLRRLEDKVRTE